MHTIYLDVEITRRKRLHHVLAANHEVCFSSAKFGPCVEWLHDRGERSVILDDGTRKWTIDITPMGD